MTADTVMHVLDADHELATARADTFTDLTAGRVGVLARPAARRRRSLASDLLTGLGIRGDASGGAERNEGLHWQRAQTWLTAYGIRDVVVLHADWLIAPVVADLLLLTGAAGARTWLVTGTVEDDSDLDRVLCDWTDRTATPEELTGTVGGRRAAARPSPATDAFPRRLPAEDFPSFRAACRRALTSAQFEAVDALLAAEANALEAALTTGRAVTVESIADWLHGRYRNLPTDTQLLTTTRAAQVVLFRRGWFLQVDTAGLLAAAADCPRPATRTGEHWARLSVYAQPYRGAICALAAADLSAADIAAVRIGDVAPDGSSVTHAGQRRTIEPEAQVYLRAQLLERAADGAGPTAPLLVAERGGAKDTRPVADVISRTRVETGLALASRRVTRTRLAGDRWQTRWGVSLQPLTGAGQ